MVRGAGSRTPHTESLGLGMSGVRHPPANDAADHVKATRAAQRVLHECPSLSLHIPSHSTFRSSETGYETVGTSDNWMYALSPAQSCTNRVIKC